MFLFFFANCACLFNCISIQPKLCDPFVTPVLGFCSFHGHLLSCNQSDDRSPHPKLRHLFSISCCPSNSRFLWLKCFSHHQICTLESGQKIMTNDHLPALICIVLLPTNKTKTKQTVPLFCQLLMPMLCLLLPIRCMFTFIIVSDCWIVAIVVDFNLSF